MKGRHTQTGLTMWGIMFIILVSVFFLFLFFKLLPPYINDAAVNTSLNGFASAPNSRNMAPSQVKEAIGKRFDINNVTDVDLARDVKIVPQGNSYAVEVDYYVEVPMIANVTAVVEFSHRVTPH